MISESTAAAASAIQNACQTPVGPIRRESRNAAGTMMRSAVIKGNDRPHALYDSVCWKVKERLQFWKNPRHNFQMHCIISHSFVKIFIYG